MQPGFKSRLRSDHSRKEDEFDIRCVWGRGGIFDLVVVFRGREQLLIIRSEKCDSFSNLSYVSNT